MSEKRTYPRAVRITDAACLKLGRDALNDPARPTLGEVASTLILAGKWPLEKAKAKGAK